MRYTLKPIASTRLRMGHSTYDNIILVNGNTSVPAGSLVEGGEIWVAPLNGDQVLVGDIWLKVLKINGKDISGWMAVIHKGQNISILTDNGEVEPPLPNPDGVVRLIYVDTVCEMADGSTKTFRADTFTEKL